MRCVQCGHLEDKVIDSRMSKDGTTIRRRRVCLRCDYRYTTYEQIERTELRVVKRDNLREALNREKILRGLVKACEKRPDSMDRLDRAGQVLDGIAAGVVHLAAQRVEGLPVDDELRVLFHVSFSQRLFGRLCTLPGDRRACLEPYSSPFNFLTLSRMVSSACSMTGSYGRFSMV